MKKFLAAVAAVLASALIAYAANLPNVPSTGQYAEPSQIVGTVNALVQQLNGNAGYAPAQSVSLGSYGTASGATPVVLNTQRGIVSFTGVATIATGGVAATQTMTNSSITAQSQCFAQIMTGGAAGSAPYVSQVTPAAGSVAIIIANGGTTSTGAAATFAISYVCY